MLSAQAKSVLTPQLARTLVRLATFRTGSAIFDDDLLGDALLRGVIAFRSTTYVRHPKAFFRKIVNDTVRDYWRYRRDRICLEAVAETWHVTDFEEMLDNASRIERLHAALMSLPTHERTLMELFYFKELPIDRISNVTRKTRSGVKMALLRARRNLSAKIARQL